eukprot:CAMPEP_0175057222 /NCGR_PEP_ID=MMETSP0052_2-20121109/11137_1 /TAXON_ID=51329 ORGANISM="Polytomella parva, Strain SAG 63-3" /NCGR_SAMPLE_ID=MMETSP0052_2 /ASSEMBLY_ACC=CAM_ASM_000194 /LENGTH=304 /DNA_ID=CAMNT_0016322397 /DNA_START=238 /DNA_END=1152 /DNA_ORIENTATION=+
MPLYPLPASISDIVERKIAELKVVAPPPVPTLKPLPFTASSTRVGCIAFKAGMTHDWDEHGVRIPLSVLWIDECEVVNFTYKERDGGYSVILGAGYMDPKSAPACTAGYYLKHGLPIKSVQRGFPVENAEALLPLGTPITAAHFVVGQGIDVTGTTLDKGFQGVMKRWGFKGLPASHGVSLSHRKPGSTGGRQDPGKIWKGKKLPGHMGKESRMMRNLQVYKIDAERNLIYVKGSVPGEKGGALFLRDSVSMDFEQRKAFNLPYPTFLGSTQDKPVEVRKTDKDPYLMYKKEVDYFPIKWKKTD